MTYTHTFLYKIIISIFTIQLISTALIHGQNITDVVRWSQINSFNTARSASTAGAFGAMGGDLSSITINPAGLGDYRISEFTLTPNVTLTSANGYFASQPSDVETTKSGILNLQSIGFVISSNPDSKLTSSNFVISLNSTGNFRKKYSINGLTPGSITTYFAEHANGYSVNDLDEFIAYPAYNTGAIFDFDEDLYYNTDFDSPSDIVRKNQLVSQKGGKYDLSFAWAGEFNHNFNVGFGLSMPIGNFEELKVYQETDPNNVSALFEGLEYSELLNTSAIGFNAKLGFLYKIGLIRIGGAVHSPTYLFLKDDYSTQLTYSYLYDNALETNSYTSEDGTFDYKIRTPWKALGSVGATFRSDDLVGFLDLDVEYIDFTNAKYTGKGSNEESYNAEVNRDVKTKLGNAINFRLGGELGYKFLRVRSGIGFEHSPFNADTYYKPNFGFGVGLRKDRFYIDLGFYTSHQSEGYNPYVVLNSALDPLANIENTKTLASLTLGFKL